MTDFLEEISKAKKMTDDAYSKVIGRELKKDNSIFLKEKMLDFLEKTSLGYKKTSEEYKYIMKISKDFTEMNNASVKFFIESNYDRFSEIHRLVEKYSDNFDDKETLKYDARFTILEKSVTYMLELGI